MKISNVEIWKFRSIDTASISIMDVTALVGENNVGKSNVLRALNAFFNYKDELPSFKNKSHLYSQNSQSRITVTFSSIAESDNIPAEFIVAGALKIRFTYRWSRSQATYEVEVRGDWKSLTHESFQKIIEKFKFVYIRLIRDSESSFSNERGEAYNLLSSVLKSQIAKRNTIDPIIRSLYDKFKKTILKDSKKLIVEHYPNLRKEIGFELFVNEDNLPDHIIRNVSLNVQEGNVKNSISDCGSGIQSSVYFSIKYASFKDVDCPVLVALEEPEQNLHPQAQRQVIREFLSGGKYPNTQFIITSHSSVITDYLGHESIVLCRREHSDSRDVITSFSQIKESFWYEHQIEKDAYNNFFEFQKSDFLFGRFVVVVEGGGDYHVFRKLLKENLKRDIFDDITFISLNGEKNIKYIHSLLKELRIPFFSIVDRDVFQTYRVNNRRVDSIDGTSGRLLYSPEFKSSSVALSLIQDEADKTALLDCLNRDSYARVSSILEKYDIVSMKSTLEADLVLSAKPEVLDYIYNKLRISENERNLQFLLTKKYKAIKDKELLVGAVDKTIFQDLPASYRKVVALARKKFQ